MKVDVEEIDLGLKIDAKCELDEVEQFLKLRMSSFNE